MDYSSLGWFRITYAVWLFGVFAYFVPASTWNPVSRFDLTRAIVEHGGFSIDAFADSTGDRALVDGTWYTDKAPIPSLLAVPLYAIIHLIHRALGTYPRYWAIGVPSNPASRVVVNSHFRRGLYLCSLFTSGFAGVVIALVLFELLRSRTSALSALVGSSVTVLGTPLLPYSTSFYGHVIAGAFLMGAFGAVVITARSGKDVDLSTPSPVRLRIAGACLTLAPGCEYITAVPAALIALWIIWRVPRKIRLYALANLALGAAVPILILGLYHTICFGAPWRTGYSFISRPEFAAGHATGLIGINLPSFDALYGLLFGVRRGLFYISPVMLLATVALAVHVLRKRDATARMAMVSVLVLQVLNAGYYMWWGGAAAGPRHLVPAIGLMGLGIGLAWQVRQLRLLIGVLATLSVINMLVLTTVGLEASEFKDILRGYAWPALFKGYIARASGATNLGIEIGLAPAATMGPVMLWLFLGGRLLILQLIRIERELEASAKG